ncbi:MAG: transposase [Microcoleus sp.]
MLSNYVYKLRPNQTQDLKMSQWVDMLRSHYNWCLNDRITQYDRQFILGNYCYLRTYLRTYSEVAPLTCCVSKNGATGSPWKDAQLNYGWYASIRIEDKSVPDCKAKPLSEVVKIIGCDMEITKLVNLSDGCQINNLKFATNKKAKRTLKIRQRRVSRKVKGSKNLKKATKKLGKLHQKIECLAAKQGKVTIKVNPKHSSTECRNCGPIDRSNRDGEKFICVPLGWGVSINPSELTAPNHRRAVHEFPRKS